ncbi:aminobenzoate oxygenase [Chryseobacterium piperi]|nr:aminobenzoate oxygenase [Chryseobacterium piperi]
MLKKLSSLWKHRAAINNEQLDYESSYFDPLKKDFSEDLLPFSKHGAWQEASDEMKSKTLSYAWGIYNLKTIYIECDIVTPACEDIIKAPSSAFEDKMIVQEVMSEALLDEALHTRMSISACNYIYTMRNLEPLNFSDFNLVQWRRRIISECTSEWERRLTRFAIACASETLITDYLKVMSEDTSIQNICHEVTKAHAIDEWSHSSVFSYVALDVVKSLNTKEKIYLRDTLRKTIDVFASNELGAWETVLKLINFPNYKDIIADTGDNNEISIYVESVEAIIDRIGINENKIYVSR